VEAVDKGLSKDDWKEIMASSNNSDNIEKLRQEVGSLYSTVDQLALSSERTNQLLQQLLLHQAGSR